MENKVISWKFSETATETRPMYVENPKEFLKNKYSNAHTFGVENLKSNGIYKVMGWAYDLRPYLKIYLIKQYDHWQQYYAPNKTTLRATIYGRIDKIIEIQ